MEIETKKDGQGNDIYHVRAQRGVKMLPSGWWESEEKAVEAHNKLSPVAFT